MIFRIAVSTMLLALTIAVAVQSYQGYQRRHQFCDLDRALVRFASTPPKGQHLTLRQVKAIATFQVGADNLISQVC